MGKQLKKLLQNVNSVVGPPPEKIVWYYKRWQNLYTEIKRTVDNIEFVEGISNLDEVSKNGSLCIFDDLMKDATKIEICEMYLEGSHHRNISVICLLQNLYNKGKENRNMALNT